MMPSLRKRILSSGKKHWDIRYWKNGRQKTHTIDETDRRTAEKIYNEFCRNQIVRKIQIAQTNSPLSERIHRLEKGSGGMKISDLAVLTRVYTEANKNSKTADREQLAINNLVRVLGDIPMSNLTPALVEHYKAVRLKQVSASTVNIEIRILNTAVNQAKRLGRINEVPDQSFKQMRLPESEPPDVMTDEEVNVLLRAADPEFKTYLQFLLLTGCRRNEALGITWADVDLETRQLVIRGQIGKMGKRRTIPINDVLYRVLVLQRGRREASVFPNYGPNQVSMKFRRLIQKVGLSRKHSLHSLRSTFGSALIRKGVNIYTVSRLLGHSSVRVTEKHYLTLDPEHVKSAVNNLDYGAEAIPIWNSHAVDNRHI